MSKQQVTGEIDMELNMDQIGGTIPITGPQAAGIAVIYTLFSKINKLLNMSVEEIDNLIKEKIIKVLKQLLHEMYEDNIVEQEEILKWSKNNSDGCPPLNRFEDENYDFEPSGDFFGYGKKNTSDIKNIKKKCKENGESGFEVITIPDGRAFNGFEYEPYYYEMIHGIIIDIFAEGVIKTEGNLTNLPKSEKKNLLKRAANSIDISIDNSKFPEKEENDEDSNFNTFKKKIEPLYTIQCAAQKNYNNEHIHLFQKGGWGKRNPEGGMSEKELKSKLKKLKITKFVERLFVKVYKLLINMSAKDILKQMVEDIPLRKRRKNEDLPDSQQIKRIETNDPPFDGKEPDPRNLLEAFFEKDWKNKLTALGIPYLEYSIVKKFKRRVKEYNIKKGKKGGNTLEKTEKILETFKRITAWEIVDAMIKDIIKPIGKGMEEFLEDEKGNPANKARKEIENKCKPEAKNDDNSDEQIFNESKFAIEYKYKKFRFNSKGKKQVKKVIKYSKKWDKMWDINDQDENKLNKMKFWKSFWGLTRKRTYALPCNPNKPTFWPPNNKSVVYDLNPRRYGFNGNMKKFQKIAKIKEKWAEKPPMRCCGPPGKLLGLKDQMFAKLFITKHKTIKECKSVKSCYIKKERKNSIQKKIDRIKEKKLLEKKENFKKYLIKQIKESVIQEIKDDPNNNENDDFDAKKRKMALDTAKEIQNSIQFDNFPNLDEIFDTLKEYLTENIKETEKDESKKDESKKDESKKDESKKDEPDFKLFLDRIFNNGPNDKGLTTPLKKIKTNLKKGFGKIKKDFLKQLFVATTAAKTIEKDDFDELEKAVIEEGKKEEEKRKKNLEKKKKIKSAETKEERMLQKKKEREFEQKKKQMEAKERRRKNSDTRPAWRGGDPDSKADDNKTKEKEDEDFRKVRDEVINDYKAELKNEFKIFEKINKQKEFLLLLTIIYDFLFKDYLYEKKKEKEKELKNIHGGNRVFIGGGAKCDTINIEESDICSGENFTGLLKEDAKNTECKEEKCTKEDAITCCEIEMDFKTEFMNILKLAIKIAISKKLNFDKNELIKKFKSDEKPFNIFKDTDISEKIKLKKNEAGKSEEEKKEKEEEKKEKEEEKKEKEEEEKKELFFNIYLFIIENMSLECLEKANSFAEEEKDHISDSTRFFLNNEIERRQELEAKKENEAKKGGMRGGEIIGQGTFGCVFKPHLLCNGMVDASNTEHVTKLIIERKNDSYRTKNEINIGKLIMSSEEYKYLFSPILSMCPIEFNNISDNDKYKCIPANKYPNNDMFLATLKKINGVNFIDTLENSYGRDAIIKFFNIYEQMLVAIQHMVNNKIIHYDIKWDNVLYDNVEKHPTIIDFGLSFELKYLNYNSLRSIKDYFYGYWPKMDVWTFEAHYICYLLHVNQFPTMYDNQLFIKEYMENCSLFKKISINNYLKMKKETFYNDCLKSIKRYQKKKKIGEKIKYIIEKTFKTWDNYSLSMMYIKHFDLIIKNEPEKLPKPYIFFIKKILWKNLSPDPKKRLSISKTKKEFSKMKKQISPKIFLELAKYA